ncbi:GlyGly-CTERM sorting domain-containing protein [Vibrio chagasii]|uniref:GlyGly-CTERM sorting domain-containing protein n=1 Tax=Vibrio chagasii TaxID=170679 RepID=A0A7Y3YTY3_9VIBR|nr:GlyGly-CTERM sorting domain-containing protein [Vibrio chagasii]
MPDGVEFLEGTDPNDATDFSGADSDGDGVPDSIELLEGTDPNDEGSVKNSDGGSLPDYVERQQGLNPQDISDDPLSTDGEGSTANNVVVGKSGGSMSLFTMCLLALFAAIRLVKVNK